MTDKTSIARLALNALSDRYDISDVTEASAEAEAIDLVYDDARREMLRHHPWRFATKFATLPTLAVTVPGGWTYAYQYPTDCLRVFEFINPLGRDLAEIEFETALLSDDTRVILADVTGHEIRYVSDLTDTTRFDPEFVRAFTLLLASEIAMSLTGDAGIKSALREEAYRAASAAATTDANEGRRVRAPEAAWITARN